RTRPAIVAALPLPKDSAGNSLGTGTRVKVAGNRLYFAVGSAGVEIFDLANPIAPTLLGRAATSDVALDVAASGNLLFVASSASGLQVIDISTPAAPVVIGSAAILNGTAKGVTVTGTLALVAAGAAGLQVIDVSNPSRPAIVGATPIAGDANKVAVN